jgi:hypothetical protein
MQPIIGSVRQPLHREPLLPVLAAHAIEFGVVGLSCDLTLWVERIGREPVQIRFRVDSGATHTLLGLAEAQRHGIPAPPPEAERELTLRNAGNAPRVPVRVRPGRLRVWWDAGLRGHAFDWPVLFRANLAPGAPPLLGLGGVVPTCRWTFDGTFSPQSPYGYLTLEDVR